VKKKIQRKKKVMKRLVMHGTHKGMVHVKKIWKVEWKAGKRCWKSPRFWLKKDGFSK